MDWKYASKDGEWEEQICVPWESGEMIWPSATAGVPWLWACQGTDFAFLITSPLTQDYVQCRAEVSS